MGEQDCGSGGGEKNEDFGRATSSLSLLVQKFLLDTSVLPNKILTGF